MAISSGSISSGSLDLDEPFLPPALNDLLRKLEVVTTPLCRSLLIEAARWSATKYSDVYTISCTGVFLAMVLSTRSEAEFSERIPGGDQQERKTLWSLSKQISEQSENLLKETIAAYYDLEKRPGEVPDVSSVRPYPTLERAIALWAEQHDIRKEILDAPGLVRAVLSNEQATLRSRLRAAKIDPQLLLRLEPSPTPDEEEKGPAPEEPSREWKSRDLRTKLNRDPDDPAELSLGIHVYAAALATILRTATGEFCFGLFGQWGIGKTRLLRTLEPLLKSPETYKAALAARGYMAGEDEDDKLTYDVVWYSAWKYRRPPEAWIFLYETLADASVRTTVLRRIGRALRTGVVRHGYLPLVFGMLTLGLIAIPVDSWLRVGGLAVSVVGIGSLSYALAIFRRGRERVRSLATRYAMLTRHGERLGLQALIGKDLRALLLGWIPTVRNVSVGEDLSITSAKSNFFTRYREQSFVALAIIVLFAVVWSWAMFGAPMISEPTREALKSSTCGTLVTEGGFWCIKGAPSASQWLYFVVFAIWLLGCLLVFWAVQSGMNAADRILLVIDDLDRCDPSEVIEIAEALKLLLEDPEIQKRVQIVMLVDEQILEFAIARKFRSVIADRNTRLPGNDNHAARREIVHEHIEKLFACHLRLPPLNLDEIGDLARRYSGGDLQRYRALRLKELEAALASGPPRPETAVQRKPTKRVELEVSNVPAAQELPRYDEFRLPVPPESDEDFKSRSEIIRQQQGEWDLQNQALLSERDRLQTAQGDIRPTGIAERSAGNLALAGSRLRFGEQEIELFRQRLPQYMERGGRRASPRAIRIFLFKYQLCHLLLELSRDMPGYDEAQVKPEAVLDVLATACLHLDPPASGVTASRAAVASVVAQVA